jgi:hypothetical protein
MRRIAELVVAGHGQAMISTIARKASGLITDDIDATLTFSRPKNFEWHLPGLIALLHDRPARGGGHQEDVSRRCSRAPFKLNLHSHEHGK